MNPFPDEAPSAGVLLRRARQSAGLHTEALAAALKVPVHKIEALEADRYDLLPDLVFARALAASICRTLGADPQPVLERLPRKTQPRLSQDRDRVNAPYRGPHDVAGPGWRDQLVRPPVLAVLALLLGALALILLPQSLLDQVAGFVRSRLQDPSAPMVASVAHSAPTVLASSAPFLDTSPVAGESQASAAEGPSLVSFEPSGSTQVPGGISSAGVQSLGAVGSAEALAGPVVAAVASAALLPAEPPAPTAPHVSGASPLTTAVGSDPALPVSAAASNALSPSGVLVFRATGPSWVEVRDAQGAFALRRMLAAGEIAGANGTPPLSVTVGKADVTQVSVRGKEFDLAAVARDNVARFQVK
jgi:cytoskeleton protein RodZ